jgi:WW domain-binding protein 4
LVKPGSAPVASSSTSAASRPPPKPSNPYANYSTAASLGYKDPDAERLKAESERRRLQGIAGEWEVISPPQGSPSQPEASTSSSVDGEVTLKREAEAPPPEDERSWKLRKKTVGPGLGDIYDPGVIPIKLKVKKEESVEVDTSATGVITAPSGDSKATVPKWTKTQWKRAGEPIDEVKEKPVGKGEKAEESGNLGQEDTSECGPKVEDGDSTGMAEPLEKEDTPVKLEENTSISPAAGGSGSMFRKRKAPGGIGNRGKR